MYCVPRAGASLSHSGRFQPLRQEMLLVSQDRSLQLALLFQAQIGQAPGLPPPPPSQLLELEYVPLSGFEMLLCLVHDHGCCHLWRRLLAVILTLVCSYYCRVGNERVF